VLREQYTRYCRRRVLWDVDCERQVELAGPDAEQLMRYLTPRDITGTAMGQGKYVPICDHEGSLINDPVLRKLAGDCFFVTVPMSYYLYARSKLSQFICCSRISVPSKKRLSRNSDRSIPVSVAVNIPAVALPAPGPIPKP
jgi:aminomethyltransferase